MPSESTKKDFEVLVNSDSLVVIQDKVSGELLSPRINTSGKVVLYPLEIRRD